MAYTQGVIYNFLGVIYHICTFQMLTSLTRAAVTVRDTPGSRCGGQGT